jgi:hypothetical protein
MLEINIEKGIPITNTKHSGVWKILKDSFGAMDMGDSFEFPNKLYSSVRVLMNEEKDKGRLFITRKIDSDTRRCWRVE